MECSRRIAPAVLDIRSRGSIVHGGSGRSLTCRGGIVLSGPAADSSSGFCSVTTARSSRFLPGGAMPRATLRAPPPRRARGCLEPRCGVLREPTRADCAGKSWRPAGARVVCPYCRPYPLPSRGTFVRTRADSVRRVVSGGDGDRVLRLLPRAPRARRRVRSSGCGAARLRSGRAPGFSTARLVAGGASRTRTPCGGRFRLGPACGMPPRSGSAACPAARRSGPVASVAARGARPRG